MANLPENNEWVDGIYQIETQDRVLGGPSGTANRQALELASRTSYLKRRVTVQAESTRPTGLTASDVGLMHIDTSLSAAGKPIWWNGTVWVDATGTEV